VCPSINCCSDLLGRLDSLQRETVLTLRAQIVKDVQAGLSVSPMFHVYLSLVSDYAFSIRDKQRVQEADQNEMYVNYLMKRNCGYQRYCGLC
jgi:hypothetical protein